MADGGMGKDVPMRFAVVGCGGRGMGYVQLLAARQHPLSDLSLYAVCDPHEPTRLAVGKEYGVPPEHQHASVEALIEADGTSLDAVVVATPAHLNKICALPLIEANIDVMMEKPPGLSVSETKELQAAARKSGAKVMVAWNRRFHPLLAKAREMVLAKGPITQVLGEFHKDMRSFVDDEIAGANMSTGRGALVLVALAPPPPPREFLPSACAHVLLTICARGMQVACLGCSTGSASGGTGRSGRSASRRIS
eukprot:SAG22_NODE_2009_length_3150_cov_3.039331_5_plen_251_part_00